MVLHTDGMRGMVWVAELDGFLGPSSFLSEGIKSAVRHIVALKQLFTLPDLSGVCVCVCVCVCAPWFCARTCFAAHNRLFVCVCRYAYVYVCARVFVCLHSFACVSVFAVMKNKHAWVGT